MTKILITAPLRQSVGIFREHQKSLDRLNIPDGVAVDRFWVVNDCPEVIQELRGSYLVCDTGDEFKKTDDNHLWLPENLAKMPYLRNLTIAWMLEHDYDYWFSVDTDLILRPATLEYLLAADKDIVSEIFWTEAAGGNGYWCNAWMYDQADGMSADWLEPGLYRVGMTGACTLVKRRVFEAGVNYAPIHCIRDILWGEDRWFGIRAAVLGFEAWVDTHAPALHLYTDALYDEFVAKTLAAKRGTVACS